MRPSTESLRTNGPAETEAVGARLAAGAGEGVEGVGVVVDELFVETGGLLLSGGPVVWLLGDEDFVLPKGSWYWSSPAPWAWAVAAGRATAAAVTRPTRRLRARMPAM